LKPAGQQTVISQLIGKTAAATAQSGKSNARHGHQGVFETAYSAVGSPDLVRDNGFSLWGSIHPARALTLQVGYTRSIHYALSTLSFGIGVNLGSVVRNLRSYD
jgi:hypothetical protein